MNEFKIGCFGVKFLGGERWEVVNGHNGFKHVTYGTEEEVRTLLAKQSHDWERRLDKKAPKQKGGAWRHNRL